MNRLRYKGLKLALGEIMRVQTIPSEGDEYVVQSENSNRTELLKSSLFPHRNVHYGGLYRDRSYVDCQRVSYTILLEKYVGFRTSAP
jgi:hypothetical protein